MLIRKKTYTIPSCNVDRLSKIITTIRIIRRNGKFYDTFDLGLGVFFIITGRAQRCDHWGALGALLYKYATIGGVYVYKFSQITEHWAWVERRTAVGDWRGLHGQSHNRPPLSGTDCVGDSDN